MAMSVILIIIFKLFDTKHHIFPLTCLTSSEGHLGQASRDFLCFMFLLIYCGLNNNTFKLFLREHIFSLKKVMLI